MMATLTDDMTTPQPSRLVVTPAGENQLDAVGTIDSHTAEALLSQLRDLGADSNVTLNLGGVDFIDSSGLRTILTSHQEFEQGGSRLELAGASESVKRLLEITGLVEHLHLT